MNRLTLEKSPYLLQHKDNPIWWYPWGEEAFLQARKNNKPIFLSIGYSSCHWCHVMEGDSFVHQEVADILNRSYVAIKVDREERPDVDQIYMHFVQATSGSGGWPLTVLLTPEGEPFWGGTFIPRQQLVRILSQIEALWSRNQGADIRMQAARMIEHIFKEQPRPALPLEKTETILHTFFERHVERFDSSNGGFGSAPKFPQPLNLLVLFRYYQRFNKHEALTMSLTTLNALIRGGIYDHVGGGFHRYATDEQWLVPHFEKMLYDNALIAVALLEAWHLSQNPDYTQALRHTLAYVITEMQDVKGGFYSAEDADSEKTEGKFYVWTEQELREILSAEEFDALARRFGIKPEGNFAFSPHATDIEHQAGLRSVTQGNILHLSLHAPLPQPEETFLLAALQKLKDARAKRIRPLKDDKVITSWNGLMIAAMARSGAELKEPVYLDAGKAAGEFMWRELYRGGQLLRRYCRGESSIRATLEDYSCLIWGYMELYKASQEKQWLDRATILQEQQNTLFWDEASSLYYDHDGRDPTLVVRQRELFDHAVPSGNGLAAFNLLRLGNWLAKPSYLEQASALLGAALGQVGAYPSAISTFLLAVDLMLSKESKPAPYCDGEFCVLD